MFGLYADCTDGPTQINGHPSAAAKWGLKNPIDDLMQAYNADHPAPAPPPFLPHRNADGSWSVSNTFIVCAVVLAVCLLFSTIALAMSKKKIKAQAFTARISTSGVAT